MNTEFVNIILAFLSLVGTTAGTITGILVSNRLSTYRIGELEKKLDKYANNVDEMRERLTIVEQSAKSLHKRMDDIQNQLNLKDNRKER